VEHVVRREHGQVLQRALAQSQVNIPALRKLLRAPEGEAGAALTMPAAGARGAQAGHALAAVGARGRPHVICIEQ
jgi:hypothetical protein